MAIGKNKRYLSLLKQEGRSNTNGTQTKVIFEFGDFKFRTLQMAIYIQWPRE